MSKKLAKDYSVLVQWNSSEKTYTARCLEIPACLGMDENAGVAVQRAFDAIEDNLEYREELGISAP